MAGKRISIPFCAKLKQFEKLNDQFTLCKCYVQALGKNRNLSYFSKESVESALPTIYNIPVVGHLIDGEDGKKYMGGHDIEIEAGENGELSIRSLCIPYGVVPLQDGIAFETLTDPDGVERDYLTADVILWTGRYPELEEAIYSEDVYFNESMEIVANGWKPLDEDHNYAEITDFAYSALCLLGKADDTSSPEHTEPCFPLSSVMPYSLDTDTDTFTMLAGELKEALSAYFNSQSVSKGGKEALDFTEEMRDAILAEYDSEKLADFTYEITEETTEESFRAAIDAYLAENGSDVPKEKSEEPAQSFSATYNQKREAISNALDPVIVAGADGRPVSETYYWLSDFDDKYAYVIRDVWTADDYQSDYGRFAYSFSEDGLTANITGEFEQMVVKWLTLEENRKLEEERSQFEELSRFKAERLEADHRAEVDAALGEFADLAGNEEFSALTAEDENGVVKAYSYDNVDDLKNFCFAIRGRAVQPKVDPEPQKPAKQYFAQVAKTEKPEKYGNLFERFGWKNKK